MTEILFVHGALVRDGEWWWRAVAERVLQEAGIRSRAVALPSCGEATGASARDGLIGDAEALRGALDEADGPALVVGHSYGGTVIAEGADHPAAAALLYISSYLPEPGIAQAGIMSGEPDPVAVSADDEGLLHLDGLDAAAFADRFLQDVPDAAVRAGAWDRVTAQGAGAFVTPTTRAAWHTRPSTYLVCVDDRSTTVALQRQHAERATRSVDLPTGHHPFLSRPDLVAAEVIRVLAGMAAA